MPIRAFAAGNDGLSTNPPTCPITVPSTAVAGDVALALLSINNPNGVTAPSGWTLVSGPDNNQNNLVTRLYSRTLGSGDIGATFTWTAATSGRFLGAMMVVSTATLTGMLIGGPTLDTSADTTLVPPPVTTAATPAAWEIVSFWALRATAATPATVTVPATHTKDGEAATNTGASPNWTVGASHRTGGALASTQYGTTSGTSSASVTDNLYTIAVAGTSVSPTVPAATASVRATAFAGTGPSIDASPPGATAKVTARASAPGPLFAQASVLTAFGGVYVRTGPSGGLPLAGAPSAPTAVQASLSGTTLTATWGVPDSDNGAPITGYVVTNLTSGAVLTPGASTFTASFTVTAGGSYRVSVAAVNSAGTGAAALASASGSVSSIARFPGDTRPLLTGQVLLGVDEGDKEPLTQTGDERAAPEALATQTVSGVTKKYQCAATRFYYNGWSAINIPGGQWASDIQSLYAKGRICWGSFSITNENWAAEIDGRNDAALDAFIAWCEETAPDVPIPVSSKHEPNFTTTTGFTATDFGRWGRWFRSRMDLYAAAHGGVGVYKWKHLSFGPIHTAQDYARTTNTPGPVQPSWDAAAKITATATAATDTLTSNGHLLSNGRRVKLISPPQGLDATTLYYVVGATANTLKVATTLGGSAVDITADATGVTVLSHDVYDWMAADPYVSRGGATTPAWTPNMNATVAWCATEPHVYPLAFTEFAVYNRDATGADKLQAVYDALSGHDIWAVLYYNSGDQTYFDRQSGTKLALYYEFYLDNTANGGLLDKYVSLLRDPRSVRFWNLTRPDGAAYAKPAGL